MAVLHPSGELDLSTVDAFRRDVRAALADQPELLVIDLGDVTFLDSSGIAVLASARKAQRDRQGVLQVVNPQPIVRRTIELVGLGSLIAD